MSKSVFLIHTSRKALNKAQMRMLQSQLGQGCLKLEGPFSDKNGKVAEIADHVRRRTRLLGGNNEITNAMLALLPQDLLRKGTPNSETSGLETPFVLGDSNWDGCSYTAGDVASGKAINRDGSLVRPASVEELTLLGVAVLRKLGVECYFSFVHYRINGLSDLFSGLGLESPESILPAILIPRHDTLSTGVMLPRYSAGLAGILPPDSIEVVDSPAVLSLMKLKNAREHAVELMRAVSERKPEFNGEGALRAAQIGHTLFDGENLWPLEEAETDLKQAEETFGLVGKKRLKSMRQHAEENYAHKLTCPSCHLVMAAEELLCGKLKGKLQGLIEGPDTENLLEFIRSASSHRCAAAFLTYYGFAALMNGHNHPVNECQDNKGKNMN